MTRSRLVNFLCAIGLVCTAPLLVKAACFGNAPAQISKHAFPEAWVDINEVEQVRQLVVSVNEVVAKGERAYLRSCVRCHGVKPGLLPHHDQQRFIEAVRNGAGEMPALGYKLNAVEAEMIRIYVSQCAKDTVIC